MSHPPHISPETIESLRKLAERDAREALAADANALADKLTRPLISLENRTPKEVFDIMCDRIRYNLIYAHPPVEAPADLREAVAAARVALSKIEPARTHLVRPVNGRRPYFQVRFAGQQIGPFEEDEFGPDGHATEKAAACADAINSLLFDLAKRAALATAADQPKEAGGGE